MALRLAAALVIVVCFIHPPQVYGQSQSVPMSNADVIKLFKGGLSRELITKTINSRPNQFDVSAEGLLDLKNNGIPDDIIEAMLTRQSERPRLSDSTPPSDKDDDFYLYDGDKKIRLTKATTRTSVSAGFLSAFGAPAYGYVTFPESGPTAALRITNKLPVFGELSVPLSLRVAELVHLVRLQLDEGHRRVQVAKVQVFAKAKGGFPEEARIPVTFEEAGEGSVQGKPARLYRMRPSAALEPGEYAVVVSLKHFFDFAVDP